MDIKWDKELKYNYLLESDMPYFVSNQWTIHSTKDIPVSMAYEDRLI